MNKIFLTLLFGLFAFVLGAQNVLTDSGSKVTFESKTVDLEHSVWGKSSSTAFWVKDKLNKVRIFGNSSKFAQFTDADAAVAYFDSVLVESKAEVIWEENFYWLLHGDTLMLPIAADGCYDDTNPYWGGWQDLAVGDSIDVKTNWHCGVKLFTAFDSLKVRGALATLGGASSDINVYIFKVSNEDANYDAVTGAISDISGHVVGKWTVTPSLISTHEINFSTIAVDEGDFIFLGVEADIGGLQETWANFTVKGYK